MSTTVGGHQSTLTIVRICTFTLLPTPMGGAGYHGCSCAIVHSCNCGVEHMGTKVVAVTINRGGQGKTMLSRSLGVLAGQAGLAVLVVDMDTQENSTTGLTPVSWSAERLGSDDLI